VTNQRPPGSDHMDHADTGAVVGWAGAISTAGQCGFPVRIHIMSSIKAMSSCLMLMWAC
jgi:hypothetical protein